MSTDLSSTHTLVELAKRTNNKEVLDIAYYMQRNPLLQDALWQEANGIDSHVHTKAANIPTASIRRANKGVDPSVAQTEQVQEPIIDIEDRSEIDELLVNRAPEPRKYRYNEDLLHLEGMNRKFMDQLFYGDRTGSVGDLEGLANRYNDPSGDDNVYDQGSTTDSVCTSIWIVRWGKDAAYLVYPRNDKTVGLSKEDGGKQLITSSGTARYWAYVTTFKLHYGLVVRKDNAVQRLGSIDDTDVVDEDNLISMLANIQKEYGDFQNTYLYANTRGWKQLTIAAKDAGNVLHPSKTPFGTWQWDFYGVPIKIVGGLLDTENDI